MAKKENKKNLSLGQIIGLVIFLITLEEPALLAAVLIIGPIALIVWFMIRYGKKNRAQGAIRNVTYTRKPEALDDCPKPLFCFHRDKGEHHVSRSREIDPWDRPDIDISKYQRRK